MTKRTIYRFFAVFSAGFFICAGCSYAAEIGDYNGLQACLESGSNVDGIKKDIFKARTNSRTIFIPNSLTIKGDGHNININDLGNMFTVTQTNIFVKLISAAVKKGEYESSGGAVSLMGNNSALRVEGNSSFEGNRSSESGGAAYASNGSALIFSENTKFQNNRAKDGGAVCLAGASADFSKTVLTASNNSASAGNGGFLSASGAGNIIFGKTVFENNKAAAGEKGRGGAVYAQGNTNMNFTKDAGFSGNSAYSAGAVYAADGSRAVFTGEKTAFKDNWSYDSAGAVSIMQNASVDFMNTKLTAQGNKAGTEGLGGFMHSDNGRAFFKNALIGGDGVAEGNSAGFGAGIYAGNNSNMTFSGETVFRNNNASAEGGALYVTANSNVTFDGNSSLVDFSGNMAKEKGGAIAVANGASVRMSGKNTRFRANSAGFGGAVSIEDGGYFGITNGIFEQNKSALKGGAVYLKGKAEAWAQFHSYTVAYGENKTVFNENSAKDKSNAIYLDSFSRVYFNIEERASVEMFDGISGSAEDTYFEVSGAGDFNMRGSFNNLSINLLGRFNMLSGSKMNAGLIDINNGAKFSMQNGAPDTARAATVNNSGTLAIDIFPQANDMLFVKDANLNNGVLDVKAEHMDNADFRKRIYKIINYENKVTGTFSAVNIIFPSTPAVVNVGYGNVYDGWVTLTLLGNKTSTDFGKIRGSAFNRKEVGGALDKISLSVKAYDPWDLALAEIETYGEDKIKGVLAGLAGYFFPNIIRSAAAGGSGSEIYGRIRKYCRRDHPVSNGFWFQAGGASGHFYGNDNSLQDYKDAYSGIKAGFDRYMDDIGLMLGVYATAGAHHIKQGSHEAKGAKTGFGVYGGYIKEGRELKSLALLSFNRFDVKRHIPFAGFSAESDIKTVSLGLDIEGALNFNMASNTKFRPYAGFELADVYYPGFSESGAGIYNLDVSGASYLRAAARAGAGVHYEGNIWLIYAGLEGKCLFSGAEPEIESVFNKTGAYFKTKGAKEGFFQTGAGAGAALRLSEKVTIFANADFYSADKYRDISGNIGLRYAFCNPFSIKAQDPQRHYVRKDGHAAEEASFSPAGVPAVSGTQKTDINSADGFEKRKEETPRAKARTVLKSYSLNMTSFEAGKAELNAAAKKEIAKEAEEMKKIEYRRIIIEGHTDSTGSDEINKKLSEARAKAVYDELVLNGIPGEKMIYAGFGSEMPRYANDTAQGRADNRRVEIFVE